MNFRNAIKMCVWLLIAIIVTSLLAEVTKLELFTYIGIFGVVLLFLNLYWLGICAILSLHDEKPKIRPIVRLEEIKFPREKIPTSSYESIVSPSSNNLQVHNQQTQLNQKEQILWN